jgi:hypothetical protein
MRHGNQMNAIPFSRSLEKGEPLDVEVFSLSTAYGAG